MTKYLGVLIAALAGGACGGTTEPGPTGNGGAAGRSSAGAGGQTAQAGAVGAGGNISIAGAGAGGTGSGGSPLDPRCPAKLPAGACPAAGLRCEYSQQDECLCYPSDPATIRCQKVDPECTASAGGASPAPAPAPNGVGGVSSKIAVPSHLMCTCSAEKSWGCQIEF
jgi:hypothetical protein